MIQTIILAYIMALKMLNFFYQGTMVIVASPFFKKKIRVITIELHVFV